MVVFLVLKTTVSDINVVITVSFWLFAWHIFFHLSTFIYIFMFKVCFLLKEYAWIFFLNATWRALNKCVAAIYFDVFIDIIIFNSTIILFVFCLFLHLYISFFPPLFFAFGFFDYIFIFQFNLPTDFWLYLLYYFLVLALGFIMYISNL